MLSPRKRAASPSVSGSREDSGPTRDEKAACLSPVSKRRNDEDTEKGRHLLGVVMKAELQGRKIAGSFTTLDQLHGTSSDPPKSGVLCLDQIKAKMDDGALNFEQLDAELIKLSGFLRLSEDSAVCRDGQALEQIVLAARVDVAAAFQSKTVRSDVQQRWKVPMRYHILNPIGSGAYGQVCSAFDTELGIKVAIKKLSQPFASATHAKRTYREIKLLKHVNHENIIGLIDVFSNATCYEDFCDVYLVTYLMDCDLFKIVKTQKLTDEHVQFLLYQILRGLKYIHSAGIIHRDLKTSNLAVNANCEARILDFGLARPGGDMMTGYVQTRWYRAPETMFRWMQYDKAVDIWSVGCIMAELLMGKVLFPGAGHVDMANKIFSLVGTPGREYLKTIDSEPTKEYILSLPKIAKKDFRLVFPGVSPLGIDLLEKMLDLDAAKRITAEDALKHPYLSQYHDDSDEPVAEQFDHAFEQKDMKAEGWKRAVYAAIQEFKPKPHKEMAAASVQEFETRNLS